MFVQLILVLLPIYLTLVSVPHKELFLIICLIILTAMAVAGYNDLETPNRFFADFLEIISEMESEFNEKKCGCSCSNSQREAGDVRVRN